MKSPACLLGAIAPASSAWAAHAETVLKAAGVHPPGCPTVVAVAVAVESLGRKLEAAGVGFSEAAQKPFDDAPAGVREQYGAPHEDLMKRIANAS